MRLDSRRLRGAFLQVLVIALCLFGAGESLAANEPRLEWHTLETPHFKVTYYTGEADVAQYIANIAESVHPRMTDVLGWAPKEKVELAITDFTDSANGVTSGSPYNSINLYLTAPDDLSPLGDVDDWYLELFTHEFTHTLHIDHMHGLAPLFNAIIGRQFVPNQVQPRWILEGLAVLEESEHTSGGRLRSSQWNMYMRADALENNFAPLDVFSNTPRRFPQGNIWYLYGSFFLKWVLDHYGEESLRKMIHEYGSTIVPFGVNRAIRRATGKTFEELFPLFERDTKRLFQEQAAAIRTKGQREGTRITFGGNTAENPRWIPKNAYKGFDLLYFRDDGHKTGGLYGLALDEKRTKVTKTDLLVRTSGSSYPSFHPNGDLTFDSVDFTKNLFAYSDLFHLPKGVTSDTGLEGERDRLTNGFRARTPSVSPDGKRVVFATNHHGTSYLQIADLVEGAVKNTHVLVPSDGFEQVFAPRFSPDGTHVAYSVWKRGGYRDIRYVDVSDGSFVEVTSDRAIDGGPAFSEDGRALYFHSDRTGVMNVYAWDIATHALYQVTNVINGAYQPAPSPDGKTLVYLGFTHEGFDLFSMPIDPSTWTVAEPPSTVRPAMPKVDSWKQYPAHAYHPFDTLRPRAYSVTSTPGNFGQLYSISATGSDLAGLHAISTTVAVEVHRPEPQVDIAYSYGKLPFDVGFRAYRTIAPRGFSLGPNKTPTWIQESTGVESSLSIAKRGAFDSQNFTASYAFTRIAGKTNAPASYYDPYDTPAIPGRGLVGTLNFGWSYSNAQQFLWSVGPEKGFTVGTGVTVTHPALASQYSGIAGQANLTAYLGMPWLRHHALAIHGGIGASTGGIPSAGPFYVGGFVDFPVIDTIQDQLIQGGIVLRGYPSAVQVGRNYVLMNAEYRFPIANIDRGISTLPVFLNRFTGALFVDYGSAFNDLNETHFKTGIGAELWTDATLGYILGFTFRLGYARGLASSGVSKAYFVAAVPF